MVTAMTTYLTKITAFTFKSYITDLPPVHIYSPVRRFTTIHNHNITASHILSHPQVTINVLTELTA